MTEPGTLPEWIEQAAIALTIELWEMTDEWRRFEQAQEIGVKLSDWGRQRNLMVQKVMDFAALMRAEGAAQERARVCG